MSSTSKETEAQASKVVTRSNMQISQHEHDKSFRKIKKRIADLEDDLVFNSISCSRIVECDGDMQRSFSHAICNATTQSTYLKWCSSLKPKRYPNLKVMPEEIELLTNFNPRKVVDCEDERAKIVFRHTNLFDIPKIIETIDNYDSLMSGNRDECSDNESLELEAVTLLKEFQEDIENQELLIDEASSIKSEYSWSIILAFHLLERLSVFKHLTIDICFKEKIGNVRCPCNTTKCGRHVPYGDTSIGNARLWHGNPDVLISKVACTIHTSPPKDKKGAVNIFEIKKYKSSRAQLFAQCIVFGFCKKDYTKYHLVPNISISDSIIKVIWYDSENDILLESPEIEWIKEGIINMKAITILWLTINYKIFSTGITEEIKKNNFTSNFRSLMKERNVLDKYENDVYIGNIKVNNGSAFQGYNPFNAEDYAFGDKKRTETEREAPSGPKKRKMYTDGQS